MTINEQIKKHQRVKQMQQTQVDFVTALIQLLKSKKLNQLSVTEVTKKAGYARRTFYSHFNSLEAILNYYINQLTLDLFEYIRLNAYNNFSKMIKVFFNYWETHEAFLDLLERNDCLALLEKSWQKNLAYSELAHSEIKEFHYAQAFALGGMYSMLVSWVKNDFQETPDQMAQEAQQIFKHLTKANSIINPNRN